MAQKRRKCKPRGKAFTGVGDPRNGPPIQENKAGVPTRLSTDTHPLAEVVNWVITHPALHDFTHEQKFYRKIKDERPAEFHKLRESLKSVVEPAPRGSDAVEDSEAPFPELEEAWAEYSEWLKARGQ